MITNYVSIIVAHYSQRDDFLPESNLRSEYLRKCIDSIIDNTTYPAELIVIDNGGKNDDSNYLVDLTRQGKINTYIRNKDNMHFAYAWNQGVKMATGDYVLLTCNDYLFKPNWLKATIEPLLKYPEKKLVASPSLPHNKHHLGMLERRRYRLNSWGSPGCILLKKKLFYEIGEYPIKLLASKSWINKLLDMGYVFAVPKKNHASRLGLRHGLDPKKLIKVEKELLNKETIDFTWKKYSSAEYQVS